MKYINDIASIISIISAILSISTFFNTKRLSNQIINQTVNAICIDLLQAKFKLNEVYAEDKDKVTQVLKEINGLLDRLYNAYKTINNKKELEKIRMASEKIRTTQNFAGSLGVHVRIVSELNHALDALMYKQNKEDV